MPSINVIGEIYFEGKPYVLDSDLNVYRPLSLKPLINPYKFNESENFRKIEEEDLIFKVLLAWEELCQVPKKSE